MMTHAPAVFSARIMVVEDEALVREDLIEFLIELGYEIVADADSGEEAVARALAAKPDLIFMDINLKGELDGIAAAARISGEMFVPIIYLTAFSDERTQTRLKQTAPFGYVLKPFDERELRTSIEIALQRARFERELDERRRWYETTLKSIHEGVVTADAHGKVTYLNPAAERLIGLTLAEAVGRDAREILVFINEHTRHPVGDPITEALKHRRTILLPSDSMLVREGGETLPVDDSAALILDENDQPLGVVAVVRDHSEQRQMIRQMIEAKKMEAVGILAGGLAHNFNNMMLGVLGNLELLRRGGNLNSSELQKAENAYAASQKAAELTRQLLSFARGQILQPKIVELGQMVRGIERLSLSMVATSARMVISHGADQICVRTDLVSLEQAVLNLILNSLRAMPTGGTLTIETLIRAFDEEDCDWKGTPIAFGIYCGVGVTDTGIGMEEETMKKVFLPFYSTKESRLGTGLGLASVESFVKQSGGFIQIKSQVGEGTSIFLYFPQASEISDSLTG